MAARCSTSGPSQPGPCRSEAIRLTAAVAVFGLLCFLPFEAGLLPAPLLAALQMAQYYARQHVILGLVPALFVAGGLATFLNRAAILQYLSNGANRWMAYGVASVSGSVLAVCSCTVLPLFAGIYQMGAGLGPATTFLFAGPAVNVAAVSLTASALGLDLAVVRAVAAVLGAVVIGLAMAALFRRSEAARAAAALPVEPPTRPLWRSALVLALMVAAAVALNWSVSGRFSFALACCPKPFPKDIEDTHLSLKLLSGRLFFELEPGETNPYPNQPLYHGQVEIPRDRILVETEDHLTLRAAEGGEVRIARERVRWVEPPLHQQGLVVSQDLDNVLIRDTQGQTHALPRYTIQDAVPVESALSHWLHRWRFAVAGGLILFLGVLLRRWFTVIERRDWLGASYDLGKTLLPRLLIGVLLTGLLLGCPNPVQPETTLTPGLLPAGWVGHVLGGDSLGANLAASVVGALMYFATLTEVPIVQGLLAGGLGKEPALALLLAGPALSLPSMLMISGVLGLKRAAAFVGLVIAWSALSGWTLGRWL